MTGYISLLRNLVCFVNIFAFCRNFAKQAGSIFKCDFERRIQVLLVIVTEHKRQLQCFYLLFQFYNQIIARIMKSEMKKMENMNLLETQSTLTQIGESKVKMSKSFAKKQPKTLITACNIQNQVQQRQLRRKSGTMIDLNQILQINHTIQQQVEESLSQLIDCPNIQPICMKKMSKSSCNELEDLNFSKLQINIPVAQPLSTHVACQPLQQNNQYIEVFNNAEQSKNRRKQTSLQRYYRRCFRQEQHRKWNKSAPDQGSFNNILVQRNPEEMQNLSKKQLRTYQFRVIQPMSGKRSTAVQNQLIALHETELNYGKNKNSVKLKDYLYQTQVSSKIKLLKRKEVYQRKKIQKKHLVSSFSNSQAPLNPLKRIGEKERKYSVKSSQILQIVKSQIICELRDCSQTIKKISEEIKEVESWLQAPKDEDLWRIFELKRNIEQRTSIKLKNALQELKAKKNTLKRIQKS